MIAKVIKKVPLRESSSDYDYWQSRSVNERIDALEMLRQQYIGFSQNAHQGIQRVVRITKLHNAAPD
jgi:Arc/MetJ family transcription regulator